MCVYLDLRWKILANANFSNFPQRKRIPILFVCDCKKKIYLPACLLGFWCINWKCLTFLLPFVVALPPTLASPVYWPLKCCHSLIVSNWRSLSLNFHMVMQFKNKSLLLLTFSYLKRRGGGCFRKFMVLWNFQTEFE